ncbi:hypothetical protein [Rubrivivax gelatinosus]|uniref:hypothetical protein n=1 Tax=Rubrivivax gelatinosus TaxID=28068 RepID=UPI0019030074|nr:hypothetical protein [Rubrivivax gelatinosus]
MNKKGKRAPPSQLGTANIAVNDTPNGTDRKTAIEARTYIASPKIEGQKNAETKAETGRKNRTIRQHLLRNPLAKSPFFRASFAGIYQPNINGHRQHPKHLILTVEASIEIWPSSTWVATYLSSLTR